MFPTLLQCCTWRLRLLHSGVIVDQNIEFNRRCYYCIITIFCVPAFVILRSSVSSNVSFTLVYEIVNWDIVLVGFFILFFLLSNNYSVPVGSFSRAYVRVEGNIQILYWEFRAMLKMLKDDKLIKICFIYLSILVRLRIICYDLFCLCLVFPQRILKVMQL